MAYVVKPEPGEKLLADVLYHPSRKSPCFRFAVSDQALFIPSKKLVVSGDPFFMLRVPAAEVTELKVETVKPYGAFLVAAVMVALSLGIFWLCLRPGIVVTPRTYGWALALGVTGILMPLAARGRPRLRVRYGKRTYRWVPPMVVDGASKRKIHEVLDQVLYAAAQIGIETHDHRTGRVAPIPSSPVMGPPAPFAPARDDESFAAEASGLTR